MSTREVETPRRDPVGGPSVSCVHVGDWLVLRDRIDGGPTRKALVLAMGHADGSPPYTVRWLDTGRTGLLFPGPDAVVLAPDSR